MDADTKHEIYRIIGRNVKRIRLEKRLTQEELSELSRVGRTSITNIESGNQQPPLHALVEIGNAFDMDYRDLLPSYAEVSESIINTMLDRMGIALEDRNRIAEIMRKNGVQS